MVIMGGPLMGFTLPWLDVPVVKITNCLLAPSPTEMGRSRKRKAASAAAPADACPADLLPQQLYWYSKGQQHDKAKAHNRRLHRMRRCAWSAQATFRWCSISAVRSEIYAISMEENAPQKLRHVSKRVRRVSNVRRWLVRSDIRPPFSLPGRIRMQSTPHWRAFARKASAAQTLVIRAGEKPDNSEAIAAREARKAAARARQRKARRSRKLKSIHAKPPLRRQ